MMIFLQINILLVMTYFFFFLAQKIEKAMNLHSSAKAFLRCAQFLIMLAVVSPMALKMMPEKRVAGHEPTFRVFGDSKNVNLKMAKTKIKHFMQEAPVKVQEIETSTKIDFKLALIYLWAAGFLILLGRFFINYSRLKKTLSDGMVLKQTEKLKIIITDNSPVPFSVRMLRAYWVAIPLELLNNKKDLQLALKHELQHHRQGDTWWAIAIEFFVCVFYFNPIIYLWKNTIIEYQEFSCDEAITGQENVLSHDYGNCLLRVAETALKNRQMYAGTTCMAVVFKDSKYFKTFLLRRIEMIVKEKRSTSKWVPVCTALLITFFTMTFAYGVEKFVRAQTKKINGGTLVLDKDIQEIADDILTKNLKGSRFSSGFVIVSEPMTGKILAVSNIDLKNVKKGHWALSELIEPASIAKALVIAEALEKNVTSEKDMHQCESGKYKYKGKLYRDWKEVGWKELSTSETLAISSDICSIKIGEQVGAKPLEEMLTNFGFGEDGTAKNFPEARIGESPDTGAQFIPKLALGYAFRSSPIELMQAFGAIANGGNLMKPIMADAKNSEPLRRVLTAETSERMRRMLQEVVLTGTGKRAQSRFYSTAGKTASARINDYMNIDWYGGEHANFAGFMGFAPVNNPRVQIYVGLIDPDADTNKTGAHGGEHAAPLFKEVAENVLAYMKVAPDKI
jgi:beta-lactamase regulating signal transducer with metallopeptidase domain